MEFITMNLLIPIRLYKLQLKILALVLSTAILQKNHRSHFLAGMHQIHSRCDSPLPSHEELGRKFVIINIGRRHEIGPMNDIEDKTTYSEHYGNIL